MKNLEQLADAVLKEAEAGQLVKQAGVAYNSQQAMKTDAGQLLLKVAALLKNNASTDITYDDIRRFRKEYDV